MPEPAAAAEDASPSDPSPVSQADPTGTDQAGQAAADTGAAAPYTTVTIPPPRHVVVRALRFGWVPLVAATLSLILSIASIYVSTRQPEVLLIMPDVVRLAGGQASGHSYVYLQPAFVSTGSNDRVEVIKDMTLHVRPAAGGAETTMAWKGQGTLVDQGGALTYQYAADAVPLLVSPRTASAPLSLFEATPGWFFGAGTYDFTLDATRVTSADPLRATFQVTIAPDELTVLNAVPERFLPYPIGS